MKTINEMSLDEKIRQTAILKIESGTSADEILQLMPEFSAGGYFIGGEVIKYDQQNGEVLKDIVDILKNNNDIPPIICADFESGCGNAIGKLTELPHLMALGATDSTEYAYDYGKTIAIQARTIGINMSFSPVADLNINNKNPIIVNRAIGDNADRALKLLKSEIKGMQDNGISPCIKHFPGDGIDRRNQHFVTTKNSLPIEQWEEIYGKIYRELVKNGVDAVMVGHICCPALQKKRTNGMCLPGTLSHEIIDYLKYNIGFDGVCISDALAMGGFLGWYKDTSSAQIECFKAGIDMLLWPDETYFKDMKKAIETGYISIERLDDAVSRILNLKKKNNAAEMNIPEINSDDAISFGENLAEKIASDSVSLITPNKFTPIKSDDKIVVFYIPGIYDSDTASERFNTFINALKERCVNTDVISNDFWLKEVKDTDKYDRIIYIANELEFKEAPIWASLCYNTEKSVVVSFKSPYYKEYFERAKHFICTYSASKASQSAAAAALFGEIKMNARIPVNI